MARRILPLLTIALLMTGCTVQRDTTELETDTEVEIEEPMEEAVDMPVGGPNIAVVLDGMWNIILTPEQGGDRIRGAWKIEEGGDNRFVDLAGGADIAVSERSLAGDAFYLAGVAASPNGPLPFEVNGTLNGNSMEGTAVLEGMGTYALTGTRRVE